jgi:hypothetical protein
MTAALPEAVRVAKTPIEIWHQDEARVGQQGTLTHVWADKGSRPAALRDQRRQSAYLFGAVCADRGVGAALVLPYANADAMSLHLAEISRHVTAGAHAVVVLDGAGWHQTGGRLQVPGNLSLLRLPPYSPELNPQENIWQYLRQTSFPTGCSRTTTLSPPRVAPLGTPSWPCQTASAPSQPAPGPNQSRHRATGMSPRSDPRSPVNVQTALRQYGAVAHGQWYSGRLPLYPRHILLQQSSLGVR